MSVLRNFFMLSAFVLFLISCKNGGEDSPEGIEHVIVIGVDGLSPDGIQKANTPVIDSMIADGSVKWNVRTVLSSSSSQNWASPRLRLHSGLRTIWGTM